MGWLCLCVLLNAVSSAYSLDLRRRFMSEKPSVQVLELVQESVVTILHSIRKVGRDTTDFFDEVEATFIVLMHSESNFSWAAILSDSKANLQANSSNKVAFSKKIMNLLQLEEATPSTAPYRDHHRGGPIRLPGGPKDALRESQKRNNEQLNGK
ncbi:hypothetical protein TNCV_3487811 [Trichonephila clavipes]|nr:hypothetical protein TNCV_3487811 [Trichonephila clavipes]